MMFLTLSLLMLLGVAEGDEPQAKPAPPAAPAQDPDRPPISAVELKALRDNNIFAPKGAKNRPARSSYSSPKTVPVPYKPKPPVVTGIFLDLTSQAHQVIVEDRNDSSHRYFKEPKFMKAGDEWSGIKVESVTQDKAVFTKGGASKEVGIGELLPEVDAKPGSGDGGDDGFSDEGETPAPAESSSSPSKGRTMKTEPKTQTSDEQNRVLEDMRRRNKKKNRPSGPDE